MHAKIRYYIDVFPTELGWFSALLSVRGVKYTSLRDSADEALGGLGPELDCAERVPARLVFLKTALQDFLSGGHDRLGSIRLDLEDVPPFYRLAWEACRSIPIGETRSYSWIAQRAGSPRACRAAGHAMAQNRLPLVVPCHRVIGSDGKLHGYRWGLDLKGRLLEIETRSRIMPQQPGL